MSLLGCTFRDLHVEPPPPALPPVPPVPPFSVPPFSQPKAEPTPTNVASSSSAPPVPVVANISNLFKALMNAGVVSANATPTGDGQTAKEQPPPPAEIPKDALREYRKAVVSAGIRLSSLEIMRYDYSHVNHEFEMPRTNTITYHRQHPPIVRFLYDSAPSQCKQCGIRYTDSSSGKKQMEDHLDMHFRQNRKTTQNNGRGHCRSWFVNIEVRRLLLFIPLVECSLPNLSRTGFLTVLQIQKARAVQKDSQVRKPVWQRVRRMSSRQTVSSSRP